MTLDELRTLVLSRLSISAGEAASVSLIDSLLNEEYSRLVVEEKLALETVDLVYTADDPLVDLPNDVSQIVHVTSAGSILRPVSREDIDTYGAQPVNTEIAAYAFEAPNRIRLPWAPEESDLTGAVLTYIPTPAPMTADDDEPDLIPNGYHRILAELVTAQLAANEEEGFLVQTAEANAARLLQGLRGLLGRRSGIGGPTIRVRGVRSV